MMKWQPGRAVEWRRRGLIAGLGGATILAISGIGRAQVVFDDSRLLPGEFTWHPERSPEGPVAVIVSIPEQLVHVYRNGIRIAVSTCSTGRQGHATPTGVFTVLQKDKHHHSSTYNNAPMPNMNRLTWDGIALHAGDLPGYPASHGCVRLPMEFSEQLFTITHIGTPVIIAGSASDPWDLVHPGLVLAGVAEGELSGAVAALDGKSHPSDWTEGTDYPLVTVLATGADRRIALIENGAEITEAELAVAGDEPLGEHVFVLLGADGGGMRWSGITFHADSAHPLDPDAAVIERLQAGKAFRDALTARMHPGMLFVVSDLAAHPDRQSGADFVIMASDVVDVAPPPLRPGDIPAVPG
jgi:hypothetical protein